MFSELQVLAGERTIWEAVLRGQAIAGSLCELIGNFATTSIRSDRDMMLRACSFDGTVVRELSQNLRNDHAFLFAAVDVNPRVVLGLTHGIQRRFPDVVDHALEQFTKPGHAWTDQYGFIPVWWRLAAEFWDDRRFVLRWFEHGFPFLNVGEFGQPEWRNDEEIFIRIAEHCSSEFLHDSFERASRTLRDNKKFMLRAVEFRPSLFRLASQRLRSDFDVGLVAFSGDQDVLGDEVRRRREHRRGEQNDRIELLNAFHSEVSVRLHAHKVFSTIVLPAMSQTSSNDSDGCALTVLNQGAETSIGFKKTIAQCIGVPTGKHLRLLRQASRNLSTVMGTNRDD